MGKGDAETPQGADGADAGQDAAHDGQGPSPPESHPAASPPEDTDSAETAQVKSASSIRGDAALDAAGPPPEIDGYEIIGAMPAGGQGKLYKARELSPAGRTVVLKFPRGGRLSSRREIDLFENEVQKLASLDHPNIARVYAAGEHDGVPFYSMEFIEGANLDEYVGQAELRQRQILVLMQTVCQAVAHAHEQPTIHRDLKPANVMVTRDGAVPKLLDFGLAIEEESLQASIDRGVGTPLYMSPEQAAGEEVNRRTDVYSLGVILYELLTDKHPHGFTHAELKALSGHQVRERIANSEVIRPRRASREIDRDLDALLLMALAHEPADRYSSAEQLAQDIDNYLSGRPLIARRYSAIQVLWKWVRRHRFRVGLAAATITALIGLASYAYIREAGLSASLQDRTRELLVTTADLTAERDELARTEKRLAKTADDLRRERDTLRKTRDDLRNQVAETDRKAAEAQEARKKAEAAAEKERAAVQVSQAKQDELVRARREMAKERDRATAGEKKATRARAEADRLRQAAESAAQAEGRQRRALQRALFGRCVDKAWLSCEDGDIGAALLWQVKALALAGSGTIPTQAASGQEHTQRVRVRQLLWAVPFRSGLIHKGRAELGVFSPDGQRILIGEVGHGYRVWDVERGEAITPALRPGHALHFAAFSRDNKRLVTLDYYGTLQVWDAVSGRRTSPSFSAHPWHALKGHPTSQPFDRSPRRGKSPLLAFTPDGQLVVLANPDKSVLCWEAATGKSVVSLEVLRNYRDCAGQSGERWLGDKLVRYDWTRREFVIKPRKYASMEVLGSLQAPSGSAVFKADGKAIVTISDNGMVRVWDTDTRRPLTPFLCNARFPRWAHFSPDGRSIAVGCGDKFTRIWRTQCPEPIVVRCPCVPRFGRSSFSPDGKLVVSSSGTGVRVWSPHTGKAVGKLLQQRRVLGAVFEPDGDHVLAFGWRGAVRRWRLSTGESWTGHLQLEERVSAFAVSPDRTLLATLHSSLGTCRVWDLRKPRALWGPLRHPDPPGRIERAVFSPDGKTLLTKGAKAARLWDVRSGSLLGQPMKHRYGVSTAIFSADGRRIVTTGSDHNARVWDARTGQAITEPLVHGRNLRHATFSPDGKRVATANGSVRIWNAESGQPITGPMKDAGTYAEFGPSGRRILTISRGGLRVWDAGTGMPITPPLPSSSGTAVFSPNGDRILWDRDGSPVIVELAPDNRSVEDLTMIAQFLSYRKIDSRGGLKWLDPGEVLGIWKTLREKFPRGEILPGQ